MRFFAALRMTELPQGPFDSTLPVETGSFPIPEAAGFVPQVAHSHQLPAPSSTSLPGPDPARACEGPS
jgi:hypothetical protein